MYNEVLRMSVFISRRKMTLIVLGLELVFAGISFIQEDYWIDWTLACFLVFVSYIIITRTNFLGQKVTKTDNGWRFDIDDSR